MSWITSFFQTILNLIDGFVGNYAWSIIILTVLFRAVLLPLDYRQKKMMIVQARVQPKMNELQKKYANDKEKLNQKTQQLMREEHYSPLSGCLPMLIQLPIFFAFFGALRAISNEQIFQLFESLQNHVPGVQVQSWLWVHNIWQADSFINTPVIPIFDKIRTFAQFSNVTAEAYNLAMVPLTMFWQNFQNGFFILPILGGVTSFIQGKFTSVAPAAKEGSDAAPNAAKSNKMMTWMFPLISVFFCATSSAVFALYWITSNIVSILFYLYLDRFVFNKEKYQNQKAKSVKIIKEKK